MTNLFEALDILIWDLIGIGCFKFEISESLNTRVGVQRKFPSRHYGYQKKVNSRGVFYNALVFPAHKTGISGYSEILHRQPDGMHQRPKSNVIFE